ncbi:Crp family transcriptional regulator [Rhodococcus triatomae BKS 15-14]|nr:Crp family transcriptional regulator [Rhodococcus triatomae BKS 15-14]
MEPHELEHRVDLFDFLTDEAKVDFLARTTTRTVRAGARIYTQDDRHRVMYRIVTGRVWLSYARIDGRELLYLLLGPGECLGISTLIDGHGLPQSATARSDVTLQVLDQRALASLRQLHPSVDNAIVHSLCRDIRILISHMSEAALDDLPARVARRLLVLAQPSAARGIPVVKLPQSELAAIFGVSRQTLNKVLKSFEREQLVSLTYGAVELRNVSRLRERSIPE